jgi:hypothetical protein
MTTTITCVYHAAQGGQSLVALQTEVAAVPVPSLVGNVFGLRVTSDGTALGSGEVVRTIVFSMVPSSAATAVAALNGDNEVAAVTVSSPGAGYVKPPDIVLAGGKPLKHASALAYLKAVSTSFVAGSGYHSATTTATVVGQLNTSDPTSRPAKVSLTIVGGHITAAAITDAGQGYVGVPTVVITDTDPTPGSGGSVTLSMGVGEIQVTYRGQGYEAAPTVDIVPFYQALFPDAASQASGIASLMTVAISQAVITVVQADPPIVA